MPSPAKRISGNELNTLSTILRTISGQIKAACGESWPSSFLTFDIESSGFNRTNDVIVEWGHCLVVDGEIVDRNSVIVNWFASNTVPHSWLSQRLRELERSMGLSGRSWHCTEQVMREQGVHPHTALSFVHDLLKTMQDKDIMLVSHNGIRFDSEMLVNCFQQDLQKPFTFRKDRMIDTGAIVKACQILDNPKVFPLVDESLWDYFKRVSYIHSKEKWNLDTHCVSFYSLDKKYGINPDAMHSAGTDAYVLHLLMKELKQRLDQAMADATPSVTPSDLPSDLPATQFSPAAQNYRKQLNH